MTPSSLTGPASGNHGAVRTPTVSVVIPCYNLGAYLDQAVQSVLDQTYGDFEIIIVDDGSTDAATRHLFESYQRPKTRIIRTGNQGLANARNLGLRESRGRYLSFLDADDLLEPTFLARTVAQLEANPAIAFASCWLTAFGAARFLWNPTDCTFPHLLAEDTVCTAALTRRDALETVGGFDADMPVAGYEDWNLAISLVERGFDGVIIPDYLFRYRIRQESMTASCTEPANHSVLMRYMAEKHGGSYQRHVAGVLETIEKRTRELEETFPRIVQDSFRTEARPVSFLEQSLQSGPGVNTTRLSRPLRYGIRVLVEKLARIERKASPRFGVIVSGRMAAEDLRPTLDSLWAVLAWGGRIVVVDDGSIDGPTREMLKAYTEPGLDVMDLGGATATSGRDAAFRHAGTPIVFAVGAGDTVDAAVLKKAVGMLEADPELVFVSCGFLDRDSGYTWVPDSVTLPGVLGCPRMPFPVLRHDALARVGGDAVEYPAQSQSNWDVTLRLAGNGNRGALIREAVVVSRVAATASPNGEGGGRDHCLVQAVVRRHQAAFDEFAIEAILGQENQRRRLQAYYEERYATPPPKPGRHVDWGSLRRLEPVSPVWGVDRGQPVDRHFIGGFLHAHRDDIRGRVLEVKDNGYTRIYGQNVEVSDVVDIAESNPAATLIGDLQDPGTLPSGRFDCFILTQTLHFIYDMPQVIENAARALGPGGVLLATLPCVSRVDYESGLHGDYWRVTPASARRLFEGVFGIGNVEVQGYGNVLVGCAFLMGLASEDLTLDELNYNDPYFPVIVCVRAVKLPPQSLPGA